MKKSARLVRMTLGIALFGSISAIGISSIAGAATRVTPLNRGVPTFISIRPNHGPSTPTPTTTVTVCGTNFTTIISFSFGPHTSPTSAILLKTTPSWIVSKTD